MNNPAIFVVGVVCWRRRDEVREGMERQKNLEQKNQHHHHFLTRPSKSNRRQPLPRQIGALRARQDNRRVGHDERRDRRGNVERAVERSCLDANDGFRLVDERLRLGLLRRGQGREGRREEHNDEDDRQKSVKECRERRGVLRRWRRRRGVSFAFFVR